MRAVLTAVVLGVVAASTDGDTWGTCRFTQSCFPQSLDDWYCFPTAVNASNSFPLAYQGGFQDICPQYAKSGCCSEIQRGLLSMNFQLINSSFGDPTNGGCPACAQNVMNLWCDWTCAPDQTWIQLHGVKEVWDPVNLNMSRVLWATALVERKSACDLYASCADTTYAQQFAPISDCVGFLNYQGNSEAIGHGQMIDFSYTNATTPADAPRLVMSTLNCSGYQLPWSNDTFSCPCTSCAASCPCSDCVGAVPPLHMSVLKGFDAMLVGAFYGCVALLSLCAVTCRRVHASAVASSKA